MPNAYTGDVEIVLSGKVHTLKIDWAAIARLKTEMGDGVLKTMLDSPDPAVLSKITAIALDHHHTGVTADDIMKASPPMYPLIKALDQALAYTYFGTQGVDESKKNPPPNPMKSPKTKFWKRSK